MTDSKRTSPPKFPVSEPHRFLKGFLAHGGKPVAMPGALPESLKATILQMDPETGSAVLAFEPDERFLQGGGLIQGGIVTTMLDYVMAMAAFTRVGEGRSFSTVSLTTHFLRPTLPGRHIARAKLDRMGARMIFASGEFLKDGATAPNATATCVMAISGS